MNKRQSIGLALALLLAAAALGAALVALFVLPAEPEPGFGTEGATHFSDLVASGDVTAGDDVLVGDDAHLVGDLVGNAATLTDTLTVGGVTTIPTDTEHIGLYTVDAAAVITTTNGALWTVGATEVWYIDRVICHVTTNFDCTGDDCTIEIGLTGGDIDGFLDLDDAELQAADAEISGLAAGWEGFGSTDTRGAFFAAGGGVIMTNDTIDIKIEDNSDQSNPTAGAATCYVVYLRIQ